MPTIHLEGEVDAAASAVWDRVKDIRSPERLTNMVHTVEVLGENQRSCAVDGGLPDHHVTVGQIDTPSCHRSLRGRG